MTFVLPLGKNWRQTHMIYGNHVYAVQAYQTRGHRKDIMWLFQCITTVWLWVDIDRTANLLFNMLM